MYDDDQFTSFTNQVCGLYQLVNYIAPISITAPLKNDILCCWKYDPYMKVQMDCLLVWYGHLGYGGQQGASR